MTVEAVKRIATPLAVCARGDMRWSGAVIGWRRAVIVAGSTLAFPIVGAGAVTALIVVASGAALRRLVRTRHTRTHTKNRS